MIAWIPWPCASPGEQTDTGDEDPCLGRGDGSLEVSSQSTASSEPGEGPFNHPSARQYLEALCLVRSLDDLQREAADPFQRTPQFGARIATIGEDMAQPRPALDDGLEHLRRPVAILDRSAVDDEADQQAKRVDDDVPLAAVDLLARVEAPGAATFGGLHGLAVDDAGRRTCLPSLLLPGRHDEGVVDGAQDADVAPGVEMVLHRGEGREVLRQHPPLATRRSHVEVRVHNLAQVRLTRPPDRLRSRQQGRDQRPFPVAQVTCVARGLAGLVAPGDISPRHRALHRIFANPTESQPTDITQLFLGQALRPHKSNVRYPSVPLPPRERLKSLASRPAANLPLKRRHALCQALGADGKPDALTVGGEHHHGNVLRNGDRLPDFGTQIRPRDTAAG